MVKKILKGGDGYTMNVNQPIGGLMGFSRYSNNYQPVFEGELLQNGGDGYSINLQSEIGGLPVYTRYTDAEMSNESLNPMQSGGSGCGCDSDVKSADDLPIFNLIKLKGGSGENITQFYAIRELSHLLTPLSINSLVSLIVNLFLNILDTDKPRKSKQLGGYMSELQNIIAPLGKNNLLVLSSLLLLHYFAVESRSNVENRIMNQNMKGGDPFTLMLTRILAPTGLNTLGTSIVLALLHQAFLRNTSKKNLQHGGNPLKNLIAPLGTNAFIATGLLVVLERLFISTMNQAKKNNDKLVGGKINKKYEDLFNLIAPITFNTFAKQSFLENYAKKNLKKNSKKEK
jgi:hypothetical protein